MYLDTNITYDYHCLYGITIVYMALLSVNSTIDCLYYLRFIFQPRYLPADIMANIFQRVADLLHYIGSTCYSKHHFAANSIWRL